MIIFSILFFVCCSSVLGATISFIQPTSGSGFNSSTIIIDVSFSNDPYGNATKVVFLHKPTSSGSFTTLGENTSASQGALDDHHVQYSYTYDFSSQADSKDATFKVQVHNLSGNVHELENPFSLNLKSPWHSALINFTWPEDTINNSYNLKTVFNDDEQQTLGWSSSAVSNFAITIDNSTGILTITPKANYTGLETFTLTVFDGLHKNMSYAILLNTTPVNDPPLFTELFNPKNGTLNTNVTIDLDNHFSDLESIVIYNYSKVQEATISINQANHEAQIKPNTDFIGSFQIYFTATDGEFITKSNNITISYLSSTTEENQAPTISSFSPDDTYVPIIGAIETFTIIPTDADGDILITTWIVNGITQTITGNTFTYTFENSTTTTITAEITDGTSTASKTWTVAAQIASPEPIPTNNLCGNGLVDQGESCGTCLQDVPCVEGESCINNICTSTIKERNIPLIIGIIVGIILLAGGGAFGYWYYKQRQYHFEDLNKEAVSGFKPANQKVQPIADVQDFLAKKTPPPKKAITPQRTTQKIETPSRTSDAILKNYVSMARQRGLRSEEIKAKLLQNGWKTEQIERVLKDS